MTTANELLRLVVHEITAYGQVTYKTLEQIENFLASEKEAELEPVAWRLRPPPRFENDAGIWHFHDDQEAVEEMRSNKGWEVEPLYTRPDPNPSESIKNQEVDRTRKPMTPKERSDSYIELEETIGPDAHLLSFLSGIAAAERYHGIGGSDE